MYIYVCVCHGNMCILDTTTAATMTSPKAISSTSCLLVCGQISFNMTFMYASLQGAVTSFYRCAFEIKRLNLKCNECCPAQESWRQMIDLKKKKKKDDRYYIRCSYSDASIIHCGESRAVLTVEPHAHFLMACQSQFSDERSEHTPDTQYDQDLMFLFFLFSMTKIESWALDPHQESVRRLIFYRLL